MLGKQRSFAEEPRWTKHTEGIFFAALLLLEEICLRGALPPVDLLEGREPMRLEHKGLLQDISLPGSLLGAGH